MGAFRMPGGGRDGVMRRRGDGLVRFLHVHGEPATVRAWATRGACACGRGARAATAPRRPSSGCVSPSAPTTTSRASTAASGATRCWGPILRRKPWLRPRRRPEPFEALAWAISEQLIDGGRAVSIQRRLLARHGAISPCGGLRDVPSAATIAAASPAEMEACGLSPRRAITMVKAAREVASGRADLDRHEPTWQRLRTISGIGPWTVECLALHGQGRDDQIPAGDLAYLKLVGGLAHLGRRATEEEVREFFEPYAPYAGLAGTALCRRVLGSRVWRQTSTRQSSSGVRSSLPTLPGAAGEGDRAAVHRRLHPQQGDRDLQLRRVRQRLFRSDAKFDSGTGWPSFTEPASPRTFASRTTPALG